MKSEITRQQFEIFTTIHTRWRDMDAMGHVNNATYLTYLEIARIDNYSRLGFADVPFIVASIKIDYLKELKHPALLSVGQRVERVGNKSFDILSGVFRDDEDEPTATARVTIVCFDYESRKAILIPDVLRHQLTK